MTPKKDVVKAEVVNKEKDDKVKEIIELLDKNDKFIIGITVLNDRRFDHYLFTHDFPAIQMLSVHNKVKELIIKQLENSEKPLTEY